MLLVSIIVLLVIIILALTVFLSVVLSELGRLADRLAFISENETNMQLDTSVNIWKLNRLVRQINKIIACFKGKSVTSKQNERAFKQALTGLSHDLRTPLTSAAGYIQMLRSGKTPDSKREAYLDTIEKRLKSVKTMLDALFEYAMLQSDDYPIAMQKVDICDTLCEVLSAYYDDFSTKGITPEIILERESFFAFLDRNALIRIFENLVSNSLKHGKGNIKVSISTADGHVEIRFENAVEDLSDDDARQLFDRFYTADKSRSSGNTGLGLAIVKELVDKTGGEIEAHLDDGYLAISIRYRLDEA